MAPLLKRVVGRRAIAARMHSRGCASARIRTTAAVRAPRRHRVSETADQERSLRSDRPGWASPSRIELVLSVSVRAQRKTAIWQDLPPGERVSEGECIAYHRSLRYGRNFSGQWGGRPTYCHCAKPNAQLRKQLISVGEESFPTTNFGPAAAIARDQNRPNTGLPIDPCHLRWRQNLVRKSHCDLRTFNSGHYPQVAVDLAPYRGNVMTLTQCQQIELRLAADFPAAGEGRIYAAVRGAVELNTWAGIASNPDDAERSARSVLSMFSELAELSVNR